MLTNINILKTTMIRKTLVLCSLILYACFSSAAAKELVLNAQEQEYLKSLSTIRMCVDPDWLPYEALDSKGRHTGLVAEYIALISSRLGKEFSVVKSKSWQETIQLYEKGDCDIVSALNLTEERTKHLIFTEPYIKSPAVLAINNRSQKIRQLADLKGMTLAMVEGYVYDEKLRSDYPDIFIMYQPNMHAAIEKVSVGEADATLGPLFLIFAITQEMKLTNIKILGDTEYKDELRIGITKNNVELAQILNKAIQSLSPEDHAQIRKTWSEKSKK